MLKIMFSFLMLCISLSSYAQIELPALSPAVEISQKIGLTTVTLSYSRPSLRGRDLFGENGILVLGKKWRTGANATTKIAFNKDIEINGQTLAKGAYAILTTPRDTSWAFHFYSFENRSYTHFLDKEPLLEITVPIKQLDYSLETFTLHFESITISDAYLVLQWANYKVEVAVKVNEHQAILANIDKVLKGPSDFSYFQAALYLHETQTDLPLALNYIRTVTQSDAALFFQVYREALILKDLDRKEEAIAAAKRSKELSQKAGNDDLARLSQQIINELFE
ncbi:DUF2911 domain-containing protein [Flavobacteriaceae bacterium M23B6Z8]